MIVVYISSTNPEIVCNSLDDAEILYKADPTNPDLKIFIRSYVMGEDNSPE